MCCASSCLSLYIIPPTYNFSIFLSAASSRLLRFDLNAEEGPTTENHYYGHYYYYYYYCFSLFVHTTICFLFDLKLKYSPTTSSIFLSSCQSPSSRATLCDIYLSLKKIIEYFILVLLVPFEHLQPKLLSG